jgi:hypothetical protein
MLTINETPENTYYGEPRSNESKYYGKVYYKNGWSYQGYLMNGIKHGYGEMKTIDGSYSKGYYLEWMRQHWLKDKNLIKLQQMVNNPYKFLKQEAKNYKQYETTMEQEFWNSKIDTKKYSYYEH